MLLKIAAEHYVKSDNYQFMLCIDKGLTKFPGGVEANYYKPFKFYGEVNHILYHANKDSDLDIDFSEDFCMLVGQEKALKDKTYQLNKHSVEKIKVLGSTITNKRDCYVVESSGRPVASYYPKLGMALWSAYVDAIRCSECDTMECWEKLQDDFEKLLNEMIDSLESSATNESESKDNS